MKARNQPALTGFPVRQLAVAATTLALFLAGHVLAQYDPALQYQDRGGYHEGLKPKPVSGYDVELLSALLDYREPTTGWPEQLHLDFFLPSQQPAFIAVRQPRPKTTYYWLDKNTQDSSWHPHSISQFSWPTAKVLKQLPGVTINDLGVIVRLGTEAPSTSECIAPAVLFHTRPPSTVTGYRFIFKTNGAAQVTCKIYRGGQPVYERPTSREKVGSPFTVLWETKNQPDGEYRLLLSGYFETNNVEFAKEITFYHRAVWK